MISIKEYEELLRISKFQHPNCYMDIVHDSILLSSNYKDCMKAFKKLSHEYATIKDINLLNEFSEKTCIKCNNVLPIAFFPIKKDKNITTTRNVCRDCINKQHRDWSKNNNDKISVYRDSYRSKKGISKRSVPQSYAERKDKKKVWEVENLKYRNEYSRLRKKGIYITKDQYLKGLV